MWQRRLLHEDQDPTSDPESGDRMCNIGADVVTVVYAQQVKETWYTKIMSSEKQHVAHQTTLAVLCVLFIRLSKI